MTNLAEIGGDRPIDMDNHYYEADDSFTRHIESKYRDLAFELKPGASGMRQWMAADRVSVFLPPGMGTDIVAPPGAVAGIFSGGTKTTDFWSNLIDPHDCPEFFHRGPRLQRMDEQGLEAILMIPSLAFGMEFDWRDRPDVVCPNWRAFNRWVEDEWGFGQDGRIFGVPMMTLYDLDWAIEEVDRLAEAGSRFLFLRYGPVNQKSPADPMFDPFWARVQETGMQVIFHIGHDGFNQIYGTQWGEDADVCLPLYSGFQHYLCFGARPISDALASCVLHNLFGRFPEVEILSIENGSSWLGPLMKDMDKAAMLGSGGNWLGGKLTDLPSEILRNHLHIVPYPEDDVAAAVKLLGEDRVLFGSDYPHPEGLANPLDFTASLSGLSEDAVAKIMHRNAAKLLGLGAH